MSGKNKSRPNCWYNWFRSELELTTFRERCNTSQRSVRNALHILKIGAHMKMTVFWDLAPYSLVVEFYTRFRDACCLHHQGNEWNLAKKVICLHVLFFLLVYFLLHTIKLQAYETRKRWKKLFCCHCFLQIKHSMHGNILKSCNTIFYPYLFFLRHVSFSRSFSPYHSLSPFLLPSLSFIIKCTYSTTNLSTSHKKKNNSRKTLNGVWFFLGYHKF
jgi:hypothetical protein